MNVTLAVGLIAFFAGAFGGYLLCDLVTKESIIKINKLKGRRGSIQKVDSIIEKASRRRKKRNKNP